MSVSSKKWRKVNSRKKRVWRKLNDTPEIPRPTVILLAILMIVIVFFGSTGLYYAEVVVPQNTPPPTPPKTPGDPFTQLWNGTINGYSPGPAAPKHQANLGFGNSVSNGITIGTTGNTLIIYISQVGGNGFTLTDSQGNTFTTAVSQAQAGASAYMLYTIASAGSDTVTYTSSNFASVIAVDWGGVATVGNVAQNGNTSAGTSGSDSITITGFTSGSVLTSLVNIVQLDNNNCPSYTATSGQTDLGVSGCAGGAPNYQRHVEAYKSNAATDSFSWTSNTNSAWAHVAIELKSNPTISNFCPPGYQCVLSYQDANGLLVTNSNSTFSSIALTTSPIQSATSASKELLLFETWENVTFFDGPRTNQPFGWYLTVNSTLPLTAGYNPLNDPNVVMAVIVYPTNRPSNLVNVYVYLQKKSGQAIGPASGLGTNPYPNCQQSATMYLCSQSTAGSAAFNSLSTVLNYTGCAAGTSNCNPGEGNSLLCTGSGMTTLSFCSSVTSPPTFTPCSATLYCATKTLPFLNIQQGSFHLGFWSINGAAKINWGTGSLTSFPSTFSARANSVYYWVPNPTCPPTCAQTDTGSFFGWLGNVIGTGYAQLGNTIGTVLAPVLNVGGSIMQAFISALLQAFSIFVQGFQIVFNALGKLFGVPNLGDILVNFFTALVNMFTSFVGTAIGWFVTVVNTLVAFALFAGSFVTNFLVNLATFITNTVFTLLGLIWTVVAIFFRYSITPSFLLMLDWLMGMLAVWVNGVRGFIRWINFNIMLFTKVMKGVYWLLTEAVNAILKIVGTIRGSGTGTGAPG